MMKKANYVEGVLKKDFIEILRIDILSYISYDKFGKSKIYFDATGKKTQDKETTELNLKITTRAEQFKYSQSKTKYIEQNFKDFNK